MKKIFTYANHSPKALVIRAGRIFFRGNQHALHVSSQSENIKNTTLKSPKMIDMDIQQQKEIFLKWIRSCQTAEQLDLLTQRMSEFVVKRFSDKTEYYEMELAKEELSGAIVEQRVITARKRPSIRLNTQLLVIPNESFFCLS